MNEREVKTIKIWEKDDFFGFIGGPRYDMDVTAIECPGEKVPLTWQFEFDRAPAGIVSNIRVEDGEVVGDLKMYNNNRFDALFLDGLKEDFRFGGYYSGVIFNDEKTIVTKCVLRAVSIVFKSNMPGAKEKA
jgi:hypothetical protein